MFIECAYFRSREIREISEIKDFIEVLGDCRFINVVCCCERPSFSRLKLLRGVISTFENYRYNNYFENMRANRRWGVGVAVSVLVTVIIGGFAACSSNQASAPIRKPDAPVRQGWESALYGDVAKIEEKKDGVVKQVCYFNEKGDVSRLGVYSEGELEYRRTYTYSPDGLLTEERQINDEDKSSWRYTYAYDSEGNMAERCFYGYDGLPSRTLFSYNTEGKLTEYSYYDEAGALDQRYVFVYGAEGRIVEEFCYGTDGDLQFRYTMDFDSEGRHKESVCYKADGALNWRHTFAYDSVGNMVEFVEYGSDGEQEIKRIDIYDVKGNCIEQQICDSFDVLVQRQTYRYDSMGNVVESILYNLADNEQECYTYNILYR